MPRIVKRILKSSLAVFLCFLIYLLRNEEGIVFYSCIAAVLCMQQDTSNTQRVAANRVVGTLSADSAECLCCCLKSISCRGIRSLCNMLSYPL